MDGSARRGVVRVGAAPPAGRLVVVAAQPRYRAARDGGTACGGRGWWWAVGLSVLWLGGWFGVRPLAAQTAPGTAEGGVPLAAVQALERAVVESIARAERSVVAISRQRRDGPATVPPAVLSAGREPDDPDFVPLDFATGVVVDRAGLIVTTYHALGDLKNSRYWVTVQRRPYEATVRAADPWLDLAVLKIAADNLEPIKLGDAQELRRGQFVIALGNPYAIARDGQPSATWGIVANLSRRAPAAGGERGRGLGEPGGALRDRPALGDGDRPATRPETLHHYGTLIQTDARLPLGTSGGALVNLKGEMIGLTTSLAALEGYETAAGFAVPVDDTFRRTLETLKAGRKAEYGFLGVAPEMLSLAERQAGAIGVRVNRAVPGTPAAVAGLQADDLITHVAGAAIRDSTDLIRELSRWPAGAKVNLTIERGPATRGAKPKVLTVAVELSKKFLGGTRLPVSEVADPAWRGLHVDYATAVPRFEQRARDLDPEGCVAVVDVDADSPAWQAGLRTGGFVSHVGHQRVTRPADFYAAVAEQRGTVELRLAGGAAKPVVRQVPPE